MTRDFYSSQWAEADAMYRLNEFLRSHWNHLTFDSDGMRFDSVEEEKQARTLAEVIDTHTQRISSVMKLMEQYTKNGR